MREVTIKAFGEQHKCQLVPRTYSNGRLAIEVVTQGERWGVLTVNIPEGKLAEGEIFVRTWAEQASWYNQVLEQCPDIFEDTGRKEPAGHADASIWKVKIDKLED